MLAEIGEAATQGMSARVDDLGIRQDELDEGNEQPVVRHLVDEVGTVGPALDARALKILFPQLASSGRIERQYVLRIVAHLARECRDVLQLGRSLDEAVARQD